MFVVWFFVRIMTKMSSCVCVCGILKFRAKRGASLLTYVGLGFEKGKWHLERIEITWASLRLSRYHILAHCFSFILAYYMYSCFSKKKLQLLACCYCLPLWLRNCRQFSSSHSSLLLPHSSLTKSLILQVRFLGFALFSETHFCI